jgi:hypothetical protein
MSWGDSKLAWVEKGQNTMGNFMEGLGRSAADSQAANIDLNEVHRRLVAQLEKQPPLGLGRELTELYKEMMTDLEMPRIEQLGCQIELRQESVIYSTITNIERLARSLDRDAREKNLVLI